MLHLSQYSRRMKLTLVAGLTCAGLASIVVIPFADKKLLKNEVGYYSVIYDGEQIGLLIQERMQSRQLPMQDSDLARSIQI